MYICTTTSNVLLPNADHNRERCSSPIIETSTLNCSAKPATTASASDSGPVTAASAGSGGSPNVCAQTRRTSPVMRPSAGDNATSRVSSSSRTLALCRLAHRRHVKVGNPQRWHRRPGDPVAPLPRQRALADAGLSSPSQQVQRALVEPEVVDRRRHLAVL